MNRQNCRYWYDFRRHIFREGKTGPRSSCTVLAIIRKQVFLTQNTTMYLWFADNSQVYENVWKPFGIWRLFFFVLKATISCFISIVSLLCCIFLIISSYVTLCFNDFDIHLLFKAVISSYKPFCKNIGNSAGV